MCKYIFLPVYMPCVQYLQRTEEGVRARGTGITVGCEPPNAGGRNQVLGKSSKYASPELSLQPP